MELTAITPPAFPNPAANTTPQNTPAENDSGALSSDFETFLKMLTVQMTNQDPLNPIESADFSTQLATFTGVEQQIKTNELLSVLGQQLGAMGLSQLAGWVGMEARVAAPVYFNGEPVTIYPKPAVAADFAELVVTNSAGQEVLRQQIALDGAPIDWAGSESSGQPLPSGFYSFSVESQVDGSVISKDAAEVYALISEAKIQSGEMVAVLNGGAEVPVDSISGLRSPEG